MSRTVVIGVLGSQLDGSGGAGPDRWGSWRPTVSLGCHDDLLIHRLELLHQPQHLHVAQRVATDLRHVSPETDVRLHDVPMADPWDFEEVYTALHDWARELEFDTEREDYLVHVTTGTHVVQICLFLLTESRHLPARLVQTSPPRRGQGAQGDYRLIDLDLSRYDRIAQRFASEQTEAVSFLKAGIETASAEFNDLIERIEHVAIGSRAPMLLLGPTGAGKSSLARRVHELKKARRQVEGDFVEVNCATLRGDAAMSALFGHVRGAFTGALADRDGLLRAADGGTLFLDEIGDLGLDEQAMLLRALEEKRFFPMGADREVQSDFTLIAGANRDLHESARKGRFRDDLLARIDLWTFELPGLAQRSEDIAPNLDWELERQADETGRRGRFSAEARERYIAFATSSEALWTRNFRDFAGSVTRMLTLSRGGRITVEVVRDEIERLRRTWHAADERHDPLAELLGDRLEQTDLFDRAQLAAVVSACRSSRSLSDAGRKLFAASRRRKRSVNDADRLRKYLLRFDLDWESVTAKR